VPKIAHFLIGESLDGLLATHVCVLEYGAGLRGYAFENTVYSRGELSQKASL